MDTPMSDVERIAKQSVGLAAHVIVLARWQFAIHQTGYQLPVGIIGFGGTLGVDTIDGLIADREWTGVTLFVDPRAPLSRTACKWGIGLR